MRNHSRCAFALLLGLAVLSLPSLLAKERKGGEGFKISGFVGTSSTTAASGVNVVLIDKATGRPVDSVSTGVFGRYSFKNLTPGTYVVKAEKVVREVTVVGKDIRMDIDLSAPGGTMDYMKGAVQQQQRQQQQGNAPAAGPSNPGLQRAMAGEYYSYTGSTERKLMLCPNGTFYDSRESSYSGSFGTDQGGWGAASAGAGSGSYAIQGSEQSGTITFSYKGGKRSTARYQSTGERGCYRFDSTPFCYSGAARCQ
ncbi:MAG: carboxypeptidase-like regulatory domain-containing protein [Acidobacteriia bacterium]|nr:carboxypeptidase-like regulatory domain-containing protein [Terriglobia bacterium]